MTKHFGLKDLKNSLNDSNVSSNFWTWELSLEGKLFRSWNWSDLKPWACDLKIQNWKLPRNDIFLHPLRHVTFRASFHYVFYPEGCGNLLTERDECPWLFHPSISRQSFSARDFALGKFCFFCWDFAHPDWLTWWYFLRAVSAEWPESLTLVWKLGKFVTCSCCSCHPQVEKCFFVQVQVLLLRLGKCWTHVLAARILLPILYLVQHKSAVTIKIHSRSKSVANRENCFASPQEFQQDSNFKLI